MMSSFGSILAKYLPGPDEILELEPEELAAFVLRVLSTPGMEPRLNRKNFGLRDAVEEYPPHQQRAIGEALMTAWMWLEREGLIAPAPGGLDNVYFITKRGKQAATADGFAYYQASQALPRKQVHPRIATKVWPPFIRGEFEVAVFQAFKDVEVRCREAGGFANSDYGVDLARKAFNPNNGPLTDKTALMSEREALQQLVAGAIGLYKNPLSHRIVPVDALAAVEMISLASHLLRIIDTRDPKNGAP